MPERVFEKIKLSEPVFRTIGNPDKTVTAWNILLQRELTQDFVFFPPFKRTFKRSEIKVMWVIGDVLCIRTSMENTMMYINVASIDMLIDRMRHRPGRELKTFLDSIRKNYYSAYGAAILLIGFLQRDHKKKTLYNVRTNWRRLLRSLTPEERTETLTSILTEVPKSSARDTLLSWHKRYLRDFVSGKVKQKNG